jgi:hypothetical protein
MKSSIASESVVSKEFPVPSDRSEYGFGFWFRFTMSGLDNGKNEPWYFLARLARNVPFRDIDMGDRQLAIWQGSGYY